MFDTVVSTDIDDCKLMPCMNDGTCYDGLNSFRCECPSGYDGEICQNSKYLFVFCDPQVTMLIQYCESRFKQKYTDCNKKKTKTKTKNKNKKQKTKLYIQ